METHSVPQHIQSYEFRLIGDMTLKQFTQLAFGLILAFIVYNLPLYGFIKWPFVLLFALLGVALAFIPIEERPLDTWIIAFVKAIYAPTQYLWKKESHPPEVLTEPLTLRPLPAVEATGGPTNRQKLQTYLQNLPPEQETTVTETNPQTAEVQRIDQLFSVITLPQSFIPQVNPLPEPIEQPHLNPHPLHPINEPPPAIPPLPVTPFIPEPSPTVVITPRTGSHKPQATKNVTFSAQIPEPVTPTSPNIIVGLVTTSTGQIVENAILEIRELPSGHPVRAMRTNKIGHFSITTPLKNGDYELVTEKEGLHFETVHFQTKNEIVPPLEIRADSLPN